MRAVEPISPILKSPPGNWRSFILSHLGALGYRDYRLFWISSFVSNMGGWIQVVAQGWLVLQLTHSAYWLGVIGFLGGIPALLFALVGGVFADRFNRRYLLLASQTVQMLTAFALGLLTLTGAITVWWVALLSFVAGLAMTLSGPAYQAMARDLAGEDFTSAIALNSTQFNLARTLGPSLAAILLATVGSAGCFFLNGTSFIAVLAALVAVRLPPQPPPSTQSFRCSLMEANKYVRATPVLQWQLLIVAVSSIFGMPYLTLLPVYAQSILSAGAGGLGLLTGAVGVGAVAGSLVVATLGNRLGKGRILLGGCLGFALFLSGFALSTNFTLSLVLLVGLGASVVSQVTIINTLVQVQVPDRLRGRVLSFLNLAFMGLIPVGNLQAGIAADRLGAPAVLAFGAAVIGLYTIQAFWRHRELLSA